MPHFGHAAVAVRGGATLEGPSSRKATLHSISENLGHTAAALAHAGLRLAHQRAEASSLRARRRVDVARYPDEARALWAARRAELALETPYRWESAPEPEPEPEPEPPMMLEVPVPTWANIKESAEICLPISCYLDPSTTAPVDNENAQILRPSPTNIAHGHRPHRIPRLSRSQVVPPPEPISSPDVAVTTTILIAMPVPPARRSHNPHAPPPHVEMGLMRTNMPAGAEAMFPQSRERGEGGQREINIDAQNIKRMPVLSSLASGHNRAFCPQLPEEN